MVFDGATKPDSVVKLHSDSVVKRRQLASWGRWYAASCEYPEFNIHGPFGEGNTTEPAQCPEHWTWRAKQLKSLKNLQDDGSDPAGLTLQDSYDSRRITNVTGQMDTPGSLRSVSDEQGTGIEGGQEMEADLVSCRASSLPEGRPRVCMAPVKTYQKLDDHYLPSNLYSGVRSRPFYKDYRHYSRYGFAGRGAKSAWAANPRQSTADYDPAEALYTKPVGARSYNETFVHGTARCDQRPIMTQLQKQMMHEYEDHNVGWVGL